MVERPGFHCSVYLSTISWEFLGTRISPCHHEEPFSCLLCEDTVFAHWISVLIWEVLFWIVGTTDRGLSPMQCDDVVYRCRAKGRSTDVPFQLPPPRNFLEHENSLPKNHLLCCRYWAEELIGSLNGSRPVSTSASWVSMKRLFV